MAAQDIGFGHYGADPGGSQYSPARQITPANVDRLEPAWVHHTGDTRASGKHSLEATPVLADGRLYYVTSRNVVLAVDARTGEEIWRFDPELALDGGYAESAARGVTLWRGEAERWT